MDWTLVLVMTPVARATKAAEANHKAFSIYEARHAAEANQVFRSSGMLVQDEQVRAAFDTSLGLSDIASMSEILKKILYEQGIPFTVAPYSALAQVGSDVQTFLCLTNHP